jgi:hypothetical protein
MGILTRHTALWLLAAVVLLPHALLAEKGADLSSQAAIAPEVVNDITELGAGDKRRAELTLDGSGDTMRFKCLTDADSVCMRWEETVVYVTHEVCGVLEICYDGWKYVNRLGTSKCACQKLSGDGMRCAEYSCTRDWIIQGGNRSSAGPGTSSSWIALLASFVLFMYAY